MTYRLALTGGSRFAIRLGEEPFTTYSVVTPSGGLHLYFELPAGATVPSKNGVLATHVDIKSNGGYVLQPARALMSVTTNGSSRSMR
jgi:hypothetical protein